MNRLRIYFDSPAGQGAGEKRGRGGIEGLRAKPVVEPKSNRNIQPPSGPRSHQTAVRSEEPQPAPIIEGKTSAQEEDELDGEPMEDNEETTVPGESSDLTFSHDEEDAVESLATETEEADSTKPTPLIPSTIETVSANTSTTPSDEAQVSVSHEVSLPVAPSPFKISSTQTDASAVPDEVTIAAASNVEPEEVGDVSMTSVRASVEPEAAAALTPLQKDDINAQGLAPSDDASNVPEPITTTASDHIEPPSSPHKPHPYTDAPVLANNLRSPSPTLSHLVADSQPKPTAKPTHIPPTNQELQAEKSFPIYTGPEPSPNRVSILYQQCSRRLCIDAEVVERVRVSRAEGKLEFTIRWRKGEKPVDAAPAAAPASAPSPSTSAPQAQANETVDVKQDEAGEKEPPMEKGIKQEEPPASPMKISSPVKQEVVEPTSGIPEPESGASGEAVNGQESAASTLR